MNAVNKVQHNKFSKVTMIPQSTHCDHFVTNLTDQNTNFNGELSSAVFEIK